MFVHFRHWSEINSRIKSRKRIEISFPPATAAERGRKFLIEKNWNLIRKNDEWNTEGTLYRIQKHKNYIYNIIYIIYIDLIVPTFWNQHVAVKKRQLYLLSSTTKVVPPGYMMGTKVGLLDMMSTTRGRNKQMLQWWWWAGSKLPVPYRGVYGSIWQQLSDCTPDPRPPQSPPPTTDSRYRYSTAVRSYINDDESTVLGTDVPFAGSRDTVGKKGSSRVSISDTSPTRGRKKCCNDDESDLTTGIWQQLSDCTLDTPTA